MKRRARGLVGRPRPYTARGIARVPCQRCGRPSAFDWTVRACAAAGRAGDRHVGLCAACDVRLNALVLDYFRIPNRRAFLRAYTRRVLGD